MHLGYCKERAICTIVAENGVLVQEVDSHFSDLNKVVGTVFYANTKVPRGGKLDV